MRIFLLVIDSFGIGGAVDAELYGDVGSNTYINILKKTNLELKEMISLGLNNIDGIDEKGVSKPRAMFGRMVELAYGKDTTTGHWELAGLTLEKAFPTFPNGFPQNVVEEIEKQAGVKFMFNGVASGTEIINRLGAEHIRTAMPILYTSADSVMQIACHTDVMSLEKLYEICKVARKIMMGENEVSRIIARPFSTVDGVFKRTEDRKDFSVRPTKKTMLDKIAESGKAVISIGKIADIFGGSGITESVHTANNSEGMSELLTIAEYDFDGLCFANLVDTDMLYGHRNNVEGYAKALIDIDEFLPKLESKLKKDDILIITADHGCDPTTASTDHSRENVPLLIYGKKITPKNLGTISGFDYVSKFVLNAFGIKE